MRRRFGFSSYDERLGPMETPCWIFHAAADHEGYTKMTTASGVKVGAHRAFYEHHVGPIPEGLHIDHLCRVPACVNPAHLEAVTAAENILRGTCPAAVNARKTHCKRGHEFTPENTYLLGKRRACRECRREHDRINKRQARKEGREWKPKRLFDCPGCERERPYYSSGKCRSCYHRDYMRAHRAKKAVSDLHVVATAEALER